MIDRLKRAGLFVARRVLLPAALFVIYLIGVGLTSLLARLLRPAPKSGWVPAAGYGLDPERLRRQS